MSLRLQECAAKLFRGKHILKELWLIFMAIPMDFRGKSLLNFREIKFYFILKVH